MEIICLRHAESIGNVFFHKSYVENDHSHFTPDFKKIPSREWPLTEEGISHSKKAGEFIKENFFPIDNFLSSDFPRAKETAILTGLSDHWSYTSFLRERSRGLADGLSKEEWKDLSCKENVPFNEDSIDWRPPQGESAREMISRLSNLLQQMSKEGVKRSLLVTHGELIQCLRFMIRNMPFEKYPEWIDIRGDVKNCQVFQFVMNSNGTQEISHLLKSGAYVSEDCSYFSNPKK